MIAEFDAMLILNVCISMRMRACVCAGVRMFICVYAHVCVCKHIMRGCLCPYVCTCIVLYYYQCNERVNRGTHAYSYW